MPVIAAFVLALASGTAFAQDRSPGLFDNMFNRGQQQQQAEPERPQGGPPDTSESARISRIEAALRQLTGTIEQLQHDNQMLQMQLKRMQDDTEFRFQQRGGTPAPGATPGSAPMPPAGSPPPANSGRRSDVFDPSKSPTAPGAPRTLGNASASAMPANPPIMNEAPNNAQGGAQVGAQIGAPGGRDVGAPLDLSTLSANPPADQPPAGTQTAAIPAPQLPPVMSRPNTPPAGQQLATLPPSSSPKDEYDLAYGYVLRKDYALAAQAFHDFMSKYPNDKMRPNAEFWLGESQYQQQRYREAAESFLAVSTKYEKSSKAPESLLRLGQSLGALHQKEAACATLAEVGRKYPKASPQVKRDVTQEQKRGHC
jgi:tol-pal system protein YbgF